MNLYDEIEKVTGVRPAEVLEDACRGTAIQVEMPDGWPRLFFDLDGGRRLALRNAEICLENAGAFTQEIFDQVADLSQYTFPVRPTNERESLGMSYEHYRRYRDILTKVRKDRLRGRKVDSKEWPAWAEIEQMAREASAG
jgi:hypothetical protein